MAAARCKRFCPSSRKMAQPLAAMTLADSCSTRCSRGCSCRSELRAADKSRNWEMVAFICDMACVSRLISRIWLRCSIGFEKSNASIARASSANCSSGLDTQRLACQTIGISASRISRVSHICWSRRRIASCSNSSSGEASTSHMSCWPMWTRLARPSQWRPSTCASCVVLSPWACSRMAAITGSLSGASLLLRGCSAISAPVCPARTRSCGSSRYLRVEGVIGMLPSSLSSCCKVRSAPITPPLLMQGCASVMPASPDR